MLILFLAVALQAGAAQDQPDQVRARYDEISARIRALSALTSTPRQTIESLIEVGNLRSELLCYENELERANPLVRDRIARDENYRASFFSGDAFSYRVRFRRISDLRKCLAERHIQSLEIVDVDVSDPGQVIVEGRIRNTTPVPAGVTLSADSARRKANGEVYRYSVVRSGPSWRVRQAFRHDQYAENGLRAEYEPTDRFQVAYWYTSAD